MKLSLLIILCISTLPVSAAEITGRFAPPAGKGAYLFRTRQHLRWRHREI